MLDTSYLEKTFTRITNNVWLNSNINPDTVIVRYINLPILLGLINGEYYFTYRSSFTDQHEKGEFYDSRNLFKHFYPANGHAPKKVLEQWKLQDSQRDICYSLPCSCWSLEERENYLMWKAYSSNNIGIRVQSTIKRFTESLDLRNNKLFGSKMEYGKESYPNQIFNWMFWKQEHYDNEKEYRFYICCPQSDSSNTINGCILPINPERLIDRVIISPFIQKHSALDIIKILNRKPYLNGKIDCSFILEY